jgi:hypothetical protein
MQTLAIDLETKILDDLDDKFVAIPRIGLDHPELLKVINKNESKYSLNWHLVTIFFTLLLMPFKCVSLRL